MQKNLTLSSNSNLIGFEQRLTISSSLIQRVESYNADAYFHFMCGKLAYFDKRFVPAIDYFNKVESYFESLPINQRFDFKSGKRVPFEEHINSLMLRGNANFSLKRYEEAISDYSKCIELDNTTQDAFRNRAVCYMNNQKFSLALNDLNQITKIKEFCPEIHRYIAYCYQELEDFPKSQFHFSISASQGDEESLKIINNRNGR